MADTSIEAYRSLDLNSLQEIVLGAIGSMGSCTCEEVELTLGMKHQTASARIKELHDLGLIEVTGKKKTTSGRNARVYSPT